METPLVILFAALGLLLIGVIISLVAIFKLKNQQQALIKQLEYEQVKTSVNPHTPQPLAKLAFISSPISIQNIPSEWEKFSKDMGFIKNLSILVNYLSRKTERKRVLPSELLGHFQTIQPELNKQVSAPAKPQEKYKKHKLIASLLSNITNTITQEMVPNKENYTTEEKSNFETLYHLLQETNLSLLKKTTSPKDRVAVNFIERTNGMKTEVDSFGPSSTGRSSTGGSDESNKNNGVNKQLFCSPDSSKSTVR